MDQLPDHVVALLIRLCILAPVVYAGLLMATDPARVVGVVNDMVAEIVWIETSLRWPQLWRPPLDAEPLGDSCQGRVFVRNVGLLLAATGLIHIVGVVS